MAHPADSLPKCNFEGLPMPMLSLNINGEQAVEIHKYRFVAGGKLEVHKRSLWSFTVECTFQIGHFVRGYDHPMFPDTLNALRDYYQLGHVGVLTVPHIGRVLVLLKEWSESVRGESSTGANVTARFIEHGTSSFGQNELQDVAAISFAAKSSKLVREVAKLTDPPGLFEQIFQVAGEIQGFRDQLLLQSELISARIDSIRGLFEEADRTLDIFDDPQNFPILQAMQELWAATIELSTSPQARVVRPKTYIVDQTMSVMEVAQRIYGDNNRARDILELNQFDDAMKIPTGTQVRYIPDSL